MALELDHEWPEKILRGWAKAYRETPEYRFPSDPSAEFFPVDMETAADEIVRLRAIEMAAKSVIELWPTASISHYPMIDELVRLRETLAPQQS